MHCKPHRSLALLYATGFIVAGRAAHAGGWGTKAALPSATYEPAVAAIDGIIYVVGGNNGSTPTATLQAYDPTRNTWRTLASMPSAFDSGNGTDVINGQLYVAGGAYNTSNLPSANLFVYDPPSNSWATRASMSHLSGCGATGAIRGKLYVVTACNGDAGWTNALDVYDPVANTWTSLPGSSVAHNLPAFGVINDKLYVAGGYSNTGNNGVTEVFDPTTNSWTTLAPMPMPAYATGSVALNGQLYVFGGYGVTRLQTVQVYNPATKKWRTLATPMPDTIEAAGATVDYGILFLEGGLNAQAAVLSTNYFLAIPPSIP